MRNAFVYVLVMSLFFIACSKTNEEIESKRNTTTGGTTGNCDTIYMRYKANVQPILQAHCYSCHGNGKAESGVTLDNYTTVKQRAQSGVLMGVITHASGYPAMPYQLPKLSDCEINTIRDWINWGALNN